MELVAIGFASFIGGMTISRIFYNIHKSNTDNRYNNSWTPINQTKTNQKIEGLLTGVPANFKPTANQPVSPPNSRPSIPATNYKYWSLMNPRSLQHPAPGSTLQSPVNLLPNLDVSQNSNTLPDATPVQQPIENLSQLLGRQSSTDIDLSLPNTGQAPSVIDDERRNLAADAAVTLPANPLPNPTATPPANPTATPSLDNHAIIMVAKINSSEDPNYTSP